MEKSFGNIVLIGMPASGKSTAGVILAKVLGMDFVDTDLLIQRKTGRKLPELIREKGLSGFLAVEEETCLAVEAENTVIATGGSVVYGKMAMEHLRSIGTVIYLKAEYGTLTKRLRNIKQRGVVLKEGQTLKELYAERTALYEKYADAVVSEDGRDIEDTVSGIIEALSKRM